MDDNTQSENAITITAPNDTLAQSPQSPPLPLEPTVHLVARNPSQMAAAQSELTLWLTAKITSLEKEISDLSSARDEAKRHKWKTSAFSSPISKFCHQREFYQKILAAVEAGYTLVPNFPIDVFAIRVGSKDNYPKGGEQYGGAHRADYLAEQPDVLPANEGDYVSPKPIGRHFVKNEKEGDKLVTRWYFNPTRLQEAEFPFAIARPEIMTATAEAMAIKVFDQIGVCNHSANQSVSRVKGKGDPLLIGRVILDVEKYGWVHKPVSFLIAWHLDLRTL